MGVIHSVSGWNFREACALLHDKGYGSLAVLYVRYAGPWFLHALVEYLCAAIAVGQIAKFEQQGFG